MIFAVAMVTRKVNAVSLMHLCRIKMARAMARTMERAIRKTMNKTRVSARVWRIRASAMVATARTISTAKEAQIDLAEEREDGGVSTRS